MAFAPAELARTQPARKRSLFAKNAPNYQDFSTPPDGDFVRYVEGLMAWGEQEQERLRLQALGERSRGASDIQWGRIATGAPIAPGAVQPAAPAKGGALLGSAEAPLERLKRKLHDEVARLQQQALQTQQAPAPKLAQKKLLQSASSGAVPAAKVVHGLSMVLGLAAFVAAGVFAPAWLPVVIIGWVVFGVILAVRAGSLKS